MSLILLVLALLVTPAWADPTPWQIEIQGGRYEVVRLTAVEVPLPVGRPSYFVRSGQMWHPIRLYATYDEVYRLCVSDTRLVEGACEEQR